MDESKLKKIIKEEINDFFFNKLIENYDWLKTDNFGFIQSSFLHLLKEYRVNLNNIYESKKIVFPQFGTGYVFKDSTDKEHVSAIQKTGTIKIGVLVKTTNDNPVILTRKINSTNDEKILNTHISNIIKLIDELKLIKIDFSPESSDQFYNARKRLFMNIVNQFPDKVEDVRTNGDNFEIFLKQQNLEK